MLPLLTPGKTLDAALATAIEASPDSPYELTLNVDAAGLPLQPLAGEGTELLLQDQLILTVNPIARDVDGTAIALCTTVVVTPDGGRRLSKRPLELMLTSRSFLSAYTGWRPPEPRPPEPTAPWLRER
jgi:hypothetical protein